MTSRSIHLVLLRFLLLFVKLNGSNSMPITVSLFWNTKMRFETAWWGGWGLNCWLNSLKDK